MKKVVKFGGSSLASAEQFQKVGDIIRADKSRRYVDTFCSGKAQFQRHKGHRYALQLLQSCDP